MAKLANAGKYPLYFLSYRLYEGDWHTISAHDGALDVQHPDGLWRMLSVEARVGSPSFDNTHYLRSGGSSSPACWDRSSKPESMLPVSGADLALRQSLWLKTDEAYKEAERRYALLQASQEVLSKEDDTSGDFSVQPAHSYSTQIKNISVDIAAWEKRIRLLSKRFQKYPNIYSSNVTFAAEPTTVYIVTSEGTQIIDQHQHYRVTMTASMLTDDGMTLWLYDGIESNTPTDPAMNDQAITAKIDVMAQKLEQLRNAPAAEPYVGPAILSGKAAAVFFHETFGHRVESIHEKSEAEGKTFAKRIGTAIMPSFISVVDDPTKVEDYGHALNGHYVYDDEGVPAQRVVLAEKGILKGFLMSRSPMPGFKSSNGHGRASPGWNPVARQGNLAVIADPSKQVSPQKLREMLIQEIIKQNKPYGLLFDEISGGSTWTSSYMNQSYSINPLRVFKVYPDGRPDELVRGVDIVGTPLSALEKIMAADTDYEVFNGRCGRDSGLVPVSASAPSLLIESLETKRAAKSFHRPPILPDPAKSLQSVPSSAREKKKQ